ncbi:hypothetical protein BD410DRAFT_802792 [Rickenella mellea]|uniref:Uncharacterized protein n=1 Tax=Rickenella mellea TaxID=50990 RepID=A0A4Y7Q7F5_9AGAM|nr:hypothetical protein BD410DRAFT_802792 [Rickenella mellea]
MATSGLEDDGNRGPWKANTDTGIQVRRCPSLTKERSDTIHVLSPTSTSLEWCIGRKRRMAIHSLAAWGTPLSRVRTEEFAKEALIKEGKVPDFVSAVHAVSLLSGNRGGMEVPYILSLSESDRCVKRHCISDEIWSCAWVDECGYVKDHGPVTINTVK